MRKIERENTFNSMRCENFNQERILLQVGERKVQQIDACSSKKSLNCKQFILKYKELSGEANIDNNPTCINSIKTKAFSSYRRLTCSFNLFPFPPSFFFFSPTFYECKHRSTRGKYLSE